MINRFKNIKCIAYDFDGVMTDNKVLVLEDGKEAVFCNRGDGFAIDRFRDLGILQVIVSTEVNPVVVERAKKLKIDVIHGCRDKASILREYCLEKDVSLYNTMFIGNDINDLSVMEIVGLTGAPKDAEKIIYDKAEWKSTKNGGYGVIRELYDYYSNML